MSRHLSAEQRAAVDALEGPLLISAGAGAGKTRVLAERFVAACSRAEDRTEGADSAQRVVDGMLTITFTTKAAGELDERIRAALRRDGRVDDALAMDGAWISTIHGFCSRILRRHALTAGLDPAFAVAEGVDAATLRGEAFERVAREALATQPGERLFEIYGVSTVRRMVYSLSSARASSPDASGRWIHDSAESPALIAEEARAFFAEAAAELDSHVSVSKRAASHAECCLDLTDEMVRCVADPARSDRLADGVWQALDGYSASGSAKAIADVVGQISRVRQAMLRRAADAVAAPLSVALCALVDEFDEACLALRRQRGLMDFEDLQTESLRLLRERPDIAEKYRDAFRMVMVDEFQDTDGLQLAIVESVSRDNLCTVGDENQSIYRFRGAQLDVYREHRRAMREQGARDVTLKTNYRSHPGLLAFTNELFGSAALFGPSFTPLEAGRSTAAREEPAEGAASPRRARIAIVDVSGKPGIDVSTRAEAEFIAGCFEELVASGIDAGKMAVLLRTYTRADVFARALAGRGIASYVVGGSRFFGMPEVRALRAACRLIANPHDDEAFVAFALSPMSAVSDDGLWRLRDAAGERCGKGSLWEAATGAADSCEPALDVIVTAIDAARSRLGTAALSEVVLRFFEECGGADLLSRRDRSEAAFANVLKFARKAAAYEAGGGAGPAGLVARLDAEEAFGEHEPPADHVDSERSAVCIMSIHASKGLEFPVVAVPLLGDVRSPDYPILRCAPGSGGTEVALRLPNDWLSRKDGKYRPHTYTTRYAQLEQAEREADREERKRLFYVACTRAEDYLVLSGTAVPGKPPEGDAPIDWVRLWMGAAGPSETGATARIDVEDREGHASTVEVEIIGPAVEERDVSCDEGGVSESAVSTPHTERPRHPEYPESEAGPDRLSYSDIAAFERNPEGYEARRELRRGVAHPHDPRDTRTLGSAAHSALQLLASGEAPDPERIEAIASYHRLGAESASKLAELVEKAFRSRTVTEALSAGGVIAELPFAVPVGAPPFLLVGSMDLCSRSASETLVIDYKIVSGNETSVDARKMYEWQARCYGYAALRAGALSARVVFVIVSLDERAGRDAQEVEFSFAQADATGIERDLIDIHARMSAASRG